MTPNDYNENKQWDSSSDNLVPWFENKKGNDSGRYFYPFRSVQYKKR